MCKILVMPSIKAETTDLAWKLAQKMGRKMSFGNADGLGYAAVNGEGELFGERWLKNFEAFSERVPITELDRDILEGYAGFLHKDERYNRFGVVSENNVRSLILHTRFATAGKEFFNTHPFVDKNTALIHNGVIGNVTKKDLKISTCDSEKILREYLKNEVANNPRNMQKVATALEGYYACSVLATQKDGTPILDVFKCDSATLGAGYVRELGSVVITTHVADLIEIAKELHLNVDSVYEVKSGVLLRFNAVTGSVIGAYKFRPNKIQYSSTGYGRSCSSSDFDDFRATGYTSTNGWPDQGSRTSSVSNLPAVVQPGDKDEEKAKVLPLRMTSLEEAAKDNWDYNVHTKVWKKK